MYSLIHYHNINELCTSLYNSSQSSHGEYNSRNPENHATEWSIYHVTFLGSMVQVVTC